MNLWLNGAMWGSVATVVGVYCLYRFVPVVVLDAIKAISWVWDSVVGLFKKKSAPAPTPTPTVTPTAPAA